jgi:negative regulator of flagellin synthesis FlgM
MKIDSSNNQPLKIRKPESPLTGEAKSLDGQLSIKGSSSAAAASLGDKVNLSEKSKLIAKASELAALAPDIRSEKVADLTARIAAGTYKISSQEVASSILKKSLSEII